MNSETTAAKNNEWFNIVGNSLISSLAFTQVEQKKKIYPTSKAH